MKGFHWHLDGLRTRRHRDHVASGTGNGGRWRAKQELAAPGRYYGDGGTIHSTGHLDVETFRGTVVAVWFRCQMLPFRQAEVDGRRAEQMEASPLPALTGVEVVDP